MDDTLYAALCNLSRAWRRLAYELLVSLRLGWAARRLYPEQPGRARVRSAINVTIHCKGDVSKALRRVNRRLGDVEG